MLDTIGGVAIMTVSRNVGVLGCSLITEYYVYCAINHLVGALCARLRGVYVQDNRNVMAICETQRRMVR